MRRSAARESIVGLMLREDTAFSNGFSERAIRSIKQGDSETDVRQLLGSPMKEVWFYGTSGPGPQHALDTSAASPSNAQLPRRQQISGQHNWESGIGWSCRAHHEI